MQRCQIITLLFPLVSIVHPVLSDEPALDDLTAERQRVQARFPEEFAPVTDDPLLPRVLLIGDSISIGYTSLVRELPKGTANIHFAPEVNRAQAGPVADTIRTLLD